MSVTLVVPGTRESTDRFAPAARGQTPGATDQSPATHLLDAVQVVHAFSLSPVARSEKQQAPEAVEVEDSDVLEMALEGGFTLWTSVGRYRSQLAALKPESVGDDRILFDDLPQPSVSERGIKDWVSSALRILRLKADDISRDVTMGAVGRAGAWVATKLLVKRVESQLTPGPGLYRWADARTGQALDLATAKPVGELEEGKDLLIYLHGTASSTLGSFGALTSPDGQSTWAAVADRFENRVFAFEHRTLSESPIENAVQLAQALPKRSRLHLVSHSRGGLVGDLLCLRDLKDEEIERWRRQGSAFAQADAEDRQALKSLRDLLVRNQIEVVRFARVACPARGTLLASENIDQFLSILTNLVGLIPGFAASPLYDVIKRITLETVKNRWDPEMIPGIEAMIPSSPLVALLNSASQPARGALGVIAGDIEGASWLTRLGVFITDRFLYENRDNDLVVNTDSMFEGARRTGQGGYYVFDQGADVSHFNYFRNARTRRALQDWMAPQSDSPPAGFRLIADEAPKPIPMPRAAGERSGVSRPIVMIVPDLFASQLSAGDEEVWPSYAHLSTGGLARLADALQPTGLVASYYAALCVYLSNVHDVVPCAYDWRQSIRAAAKSLADAVSKALDQSQQPLRILAHGAGGLVVRQMIKDHDRVWEKLVERPGGRVVMLGAPNRGSYWIVETLLGVSPTIRHLQLLDPDLAPQQILDLFSSFPGVLELLPGSDFFVRKTWLDLKQKNGRPAATPDANALEQARQLRAELPEQIPHADRVLYVAGAAPVTSDGVEIQGERIVLLGTPDGDGRVTYGSGRLPGVATWYLPVEHGDLADSTPAFPALAELLETGATEHLSKSPPSSERGEAVTFRYTPEGVLYPTEPDLLRGLVGRRAKRRGEPSRPPLRVSVMHGDLRYASHPIMLGHYEGDTIAGAEAHLDRRLDGALSHRYQLGLYPGELGTSGVVLGNARGAPRREDVPDGAVVIGLGKMGDLNPNTLAEAVRRGALSYVLHGAEARGRRTGRHDTAPSSDRLGLSVLLIGVTSATNIGVEDSVGAILRGVARANLEIRQVFDGDVRITDLEIVEVFADAAIEACRATTQLAPVLAKELHTPIEAAARLRVAKGRQERLRQARYRDYWRRVEVTLVENDGDEAARRLVRPEIIDQLIDGVSANLKDQPEKAKMVLDFLALPWRRRSAEGRLRFLALSDRARAEVLMQPRQLEMIDRLVATSVRDTSFQLDTAQTLFELLLPNELKDTLAQQSWLVLVVDGDTASYPWELMVDRQKPLIATVGMVRQLATGTYRQQIRASTTNSAYVVGNPLTAPGIPDLPQARKEADTVAALLRQHRYDVNYNEERATALDVLNRLFAHPYRVVHLAGHGHYEPPRPGDTEGRSGMLLQDGLYLTAVEIGQMRQVPDLVFLNCCHVGQVGPEVAFNKLAASISRELIQMGVRAVVAAGWAVRDDAAEAFAGIFYERMLAGETFGRALLVARRETYERFPDGNTWGAYQAYGDPDFKLRAGSAASASEESLTFVAPEEVVSELNAIAERAGLEAEYAGSTPARLSDAGGRSDGGERGGKKTGSIATRVERVLASCPPDWLSRGDVLGALAEAYGELGDFERAADHYRRALAAASGTEKVRLRQVEQLANLEARWGEKTGERKHIERAIERVDLLLGLGETSERFALLGSAHKRLAQTLTNTVEIRRQLTASRDRYKQAVDASQKQNAVDHYSVVNWIAGDVLLGERDAGADTWLARVETGAAERFTLSRSFWDAVGQADVAVLRALLDDTLARPGTVDALVERYQAATRDAPPSPRELDSTLNQLRAMGCLLRKLAGDRSTEANAEALLTIWAKLGGREPTSAPGNGNGAKSSATGDGGVSAAPVVRPDGKGKPSAKSKGPAAARPPRTRRH